MKHVLLSFLLSSGFAALSAPAAFAQSAPDTTQTDQSEEDWRKSKKKSGSDDPWDGFQNTNNWGQGTQRTMSPVDLLPEDSRRYLMKLRAQRMANASIGEPVDASFEPSAGAKTDPNLESDEKAAWLEMMKDIDGAPGQGGGGNSNGDPDADANSGSGSGSEAQGGSTAQVPTEIGKIGGSGGGVGSPAPSVMRGGSSASVLDILAQIKGGGVAPSGQGAQGQMPQGQTSQGQSPQGDSQQDAAQQGQDSGQADAQSQDNGQGDAQAQSQDNGQADAQAQADALNQADGQSKAEAQAEAEAQAQSAAEASAQAAADAAAQAAAARTPEAISPLDRLKQSSDERASTGRRSSASDYLKRGN